MINAVQQTASTSDKNAGADVVDERLLFNRALEQFENLAESQMNDGVECFALDLFAAKPESSLSRIVSPGRQLPRTQLPSSVFNFSARAIGIRSPIEMSFVMWSPPTASAPLCFTAPSTYKM